MSKVTLVFLAVAIISVNAGITDLFSPDRFVTGANILAEGNKKVWGDVQNTATQLFNIPQTNGGGNGLGPNNFQFPSFPNVGTQNGPFPTVPIGQGGFGPLGQGGAGPFGSQNGGGLFGGNNGPFGGQGAGGPFSGIVPRFSDTDATPTKA